MIRRLLPLLLLACLCAGSMPSHAEDLVVESASTRLVNKVYLLNARIHYALSAKALDALYNGVPLTLELHIMVYRQRTLLWDEEVASLTQSYQLRYHALTEQYLVKNLNTESQQSYPTLSSALRALGRVHDFPMLDERLLEHGEKYIAYLRVRLDIESLPAPLRPLAYLSSGWRLSSDWYSWPLNR
jgi:Domain of unknown function (DUF4390)